MTPFTSFPYADRALLRSSLARDGDDVHVRETLLTSVFSVGDRSYKLHKPEPSGPLFSLSIAARAGVCQREVKLNSTLAPGVMLGVLAIVPSSDRSGYDLVHVDDERAIDHVVEMRRIDETETMESLVRRDALTSEQAFAVGARIALFHGDAEPRPEGRVYRELVDRNLETLLPLIETLVPALEQLALQRFAAAFLIGWAAVLDARAKTGCVINGHGNLRPQNVVFDSGKVLIVGRPEADAMRVVDSADELGSLVTELAEITGDRAAGDAVLAGYRDAGGSAEPEALMAFFGAHRAQVRAKVSLQASRTGVDPQPQRGYAQRLLDRSRRLNWQARGPLLLLVTGPSASGKSALAGALGRTSGFPVLSPEGAAIHDQAELVLCVGREISVIVDASSIDFHQQERFIGQLVSEGAAQPLIVECSAPADIRAARAYAKRAGGSDPDSRSPAGAGQERFAGFNGISREAHLAVDTRVAISVQIDMVASWLDSLMAAGRSA